MRILILNWRDIKNPAGGGAEILTHEMAKRWVKSGHKVTQFSSAFLESKAEEKIDNVLFKRRGKWWTVHIHAFLFYMNNKNKYDVIVDEVHWFPFFSALYAPKKTVALTCEVASKLFFKIFPYPIALVFLFIEKMYLYLYKNVPTMVISLSTKIDLIAVGYNQKNIEVLPMGITIPKHIKIEKKEKDLTLISVGRLNKQKGTQDLIEALALMHKKLPTVKLWLVGSGEEQFVDQLKEKITKLHLQESVKLLGFVNEKEKFLLLSKSHLLVSASTQEGWGLTIPEAGLVKTPAVVYNIEGFRDIVKQNRTGILVNKTPEELANKVIKILHNKKEYISMQKEVYKDSLQYSWDKTADVSVRFMQKLIKL